MSDPAGLRADAPLLDAWLTYRAAAASGGVRPFTIPGHKQRQDLVGDVVAGDVPLYGGLDTMKQSRGVLAEAQRRAARFWRADWCRFSVGGSTHGNQALAHAVGRPGDEVVVGRTLHRSLLLGLVLAGLRPVWVRPVVDAATGLPGGVPVASVARALAEHPRAVAVFLGDPSYVGTVGDVAGHAGAAHAAGVPLVVDAAWGAHFGLHPALPSHPLAAADAVVTSAHKTLPAVSQGAIVLARTSSSGGLLDADRLDRAFDATHTTSPAGAILASIDAARALVERDGPALAGRLVRHVRAARARLRDVPDLEVLDGPRVEAGKLVALLAGTGAHGLAVEQDLIAAGFPVEMADRDTIVAVVTLADGAATVAGLADALAASVERHRGDPRPVVPAAAWSVDPDQAVPPREAFFAERTPVPADEAVGRVSAELVAPYPPGIPVLAPGERITAPALAALRAARDDGALIAYAADPTLATLQVLRA
ncbi:MAG: aminotransferase class I/II-fold pyridoxal phosphate-dependent enzyme [Kineosporiaceae bacterium]